MNVILQEPSGKAEELADWQKTPLPGQQSDRATVEQERELATRSIEVSAGAGAVKVRVDGRGQIRALTIEPTAFEGRDAELLSDLVLGALAEAQRRADELQGGQASGPR